MNQAVEETAPVLKRLSLLKNICWFVCCVVLWLLWCVVWCGVWCFVVMCGVVYNYNFAADCKGALELFMSDFQKFQAKQNFG
jgi:hypothetical protein